MKTQTLFMSPLLLTNFISIKGWRSIWGIEAPKNLLASTHEEEASPKERTFRDIMPALPLVDVTLPSESGEDGCRVGRAHAIGLLAVHPGGSHLDLRVDPPAEEAPGAAYEE